MENINKENKKFDNVILEFNYFCSRLNLNEFEIIKHLTDYYSYKKV